MADCQHSLEWWPRGRSGPLACGNEQAVTVWQPPAGVEASRTLLLLHGIQSHAGWYQRSCECWARQGIRVVCPDRVGSGRTATPATRGCAESGRQLLSDVLASVEQIRSRGWGKGLFIGGVSWGAKLAVAAAVSVGDLSGLLLITPGFCPRVGVSLAIKLRVVWSMLVGNRQRLFELPLSDPAYFSDDPQWRSFIASDALALRHGSASLLWSSRWLDGQCAKDRTRVQCPVLVCFAARDRIIDNGRTRHWLKAIRGASELPEFNAAHTIEFSPDQAVCAEGVGRWIRGQTHCG